MARGARKGEVRNPKGRGSVPNKSTANAREAIAAFVDGNADRLNELLDRIADENPKAAFDAIMSVVEYHIPKLARVEQDVTHSGEITTRTVNMSEREIIKRFQKQQQEQGNGHSGTQGVGTAGTQASSGEARD
jgi:hypothetical protein